MLRQCARWPECEREFIVSPFAPGQLYCCPQCKYHAALAIQRKKREAKPKKQIHCSVCHAPFDRLRSKETYCSAACVSHHDTHQKKKFHCPPICQKEKGNPNSLFVSSASPPAFFSEWLGPRDTCIADNNTIAPER